MTPKADTANGAATLRAMRVALAAAFASASIAAIFASTFAQAQSNAPVAEPTISSIDWEAARRDAARQGVENPVAGGDDGQLSFGGESDSPTNELAIPLLAPRSLIEASRLGQLDAPMRLIARENDYSLLAENAPRQYQIQGTQIVFRTANSGAVDLSRPPSPPEIEFLEYGVELSFERYGAVYSITIYCAEPRHDPECAEERRVRGFFGEMVFAD